MSDRKLDNLIQTPSIAKLIRELDKLGYELYIKPKPIRYKEAEDNLRQQLAASIEDAKIVEVTKSKQRKNRK